jgi:hypothetical protein
MNQSVSLPATMAVSRRLSLWTLVFAILSLIFFLLLIFLRIPFPLNPLMSYQDAIDLLTPWFSSRFTGSYIATPLLRQPV